MVVGPYCDGRNKPYWRWQTSASADIQQVLEELLPFLGERRSAKAAELLATYDS